MKFIELFAGIGGFRLGLEQAGHTCVYTNEWLERPASIYERNFGDKPDRTDIRKLSADAFPDADLIVGGFPCATFSLAGKRKGFCLSDTRGTLCFEMFRIAKDRGIPYILFENVKGLLNHDEGKTFMVILAALDEMGYDAQWELLDSQYFGVPQHRERIFLIANLRGKPRPKVFPLTEPNEKNDRKNNRKQGTGVSRQYVTQWRRGHFRDYKGDGTPTLTANMGTGGHNVPMIGSEKMISEVKVRKHKVDVEKLRDLLREHKTIPTTEIATKLNIPITKVEHWFRKKSSFSIPDPEIWFELKKILNITTNEFDLPITEFEIKDNTYDMSNRVYGVDGVSPTLTARCNNAPFVKMSMLSHTKANMKERTQLRKATWTFDTAPQNKMVIHNDGGKNKLIRRLTPLECERLQGLPDNFTKYYADGSLVSDSERYERCGRTVTIPVIKAIGERLKNVEQEL